MRVRVTPPGKKQVSVHAIAGTHVVTLGMDVNEPARRGLLGFAVHRTDKTEGEQYWLSGYKTFKETEPHPAPGALVSTQHHPIQGFVWGDYTAKPGHAYVYRVVPVYGKPRNLAYGDPVEVEVKTENEDNGKHAVWFNRGVAGSQAYVRKFGSKRPDEVGPEAFKWLSRGVEEAIVSFIGQAQGKGYGIRAAAYEFSHEGVLNAFAAAAKRGADVKIVYDCRKPQPQKTSQKAIQKARIGHLMIPRKANASYISHNKFIILLQDGKPVQVLTGSTNFTSGGIYGQSNVVHVVRDPAVAGTYAAYWNELHSDTDAKVLRGLTVKQQPDPHGPLPTGVYPMFSPRTSLKTLEWYSAEMDGAATMTAFTAAFGVNKLFAGVMANNRKNVRYALLEKPGPTYDQFKDVPNNRIAIGAVLGDNAVGDAGLRRWVKEKLSGLNVNVKFLHTKYMLVDPLSDNPLVVSGSANFSDASTRNNDENMLLIKGDTTVADIYLGEFMRLWHHFHFRDVANRYKKLNAHRDAPAKGRGAKASDDAVPSPYLAPDDSWTEPYFGKNETKTSERELFR